MPLYGLAGALDGREEEFAMRFIYAGACLLLGCRPEAARSGNVPAPTSARTVFTDSAMYRAQCKEADSLKKLSPIPRTCTPRDQRLKIY
jgi:hypothetical protein